MHVLTNVQSSAEFAVVLSFDGDMHVPPGCSKCYRLLLQLRK